MIKSTNSFLPYPLRLRHQNASLTTVYSEDVKGGKGVVADLNDLYSLASTYLDWLLPNVSLMYVTSENKEYVLIDLANAGVAAGWKVYQTDLSGYYTSAQSDARYSQIGHTHSIANITGLQTALNAKLSTFGGTMTGDLQLTAPAVNASSAATIGYVDSAVAGLKFKIDVDVASTANVDINNPPATIDGVAYARVLLKDQTDKKQNGIYQYNGAGVPLTRPTDADQGNELSNKTVPVKSGNINADTWFTIINDSITIGTTDILLTQSAGQGTYTNGLGISLNGNVFLLDTSYTNSTYQRLDAKNTNGGYVGRDVNGSSTVLGLNVNGTTKLGNISSLTNYPVLSVIDGGDYNSNVVLGSLGELFGFRSGGDIGQNGAPSTKYPFSIYGTYGFNLTLPGINANNGSNVNSFRVQDASRTTTFLEVSNTGFLKIQQPQASSNTNDVLLVYALDGTLKRSLNNNASFNSVTITGTGGAGYFKLGNQTVTPPSETGFLNLYSENGSLAWINALGFSSRFTSASLTANRVYTLQDRSYTIADDAAVVHNTNAESIAGVKTFTDNPTVSNNSPAVTWISGSGNTVKWQLSNLLNAYSLTGDIYQPGGLGKAAIFNGTTVFGTANGALLPPLVANTPFTFSFWVKHLNTATNQNVIVQFGDTSSSASVNTGRLMIRNLNNGTYLFGAGSPNIAAAGSADGNWHHVCYTYNGTTFTSYVDAIQKSTVNGTYLALSINTFLMGKGRTSNADFGNWTGTIDQFLIYSRDLSATEVTALFNKQNGIGIGTPSIPLSGLLYRFEFDEGTGTIAANSAASGSAYNMTLTNFMSSNWEQTGRVSFLGSSTNANPITHMDGLINGEKGQLNLGDISGGVVLQGKGLRSYLNGKNPLSQGLDGHILFDPTYLFNPDNMGSINPYSRVSIGVGTAGISQLQMFDGAVTPTFSSNTSGSLQRNGAALLWNNGTAWVRIDNSASVYAPIDAPSFTTSLTAAGTGTFDKLYSKTNIISDNAINLKATSNATVPTGYGGFYIATALPTSLNIVFPNNASGGIELGVGAGQGFSLKSNNTVSQAYTLPDATGQVALTISAFDFEVNNALKGVILKDRGDGSRRRITVTNGVLGTEAA